MKSGDVSQWDKITESPEWICSNPTLAWQFQVGNRTFPRLTGRTRVIVQFICPGEEVLKKLQATFWGLCMLCAAFGTVAAEEQLDESAIRQALKNWVPNSTVIYVAPTPISGLFEVGVDAQVVYMSLDGRFLLNGTMLDLAQKRNLTEEQNVALRKATIATVPESEMIVFEPKGEIRHTISVFTDVDCPYCRRLHSEIDTYTERGIRVRYLAYPRTPAGTPSYKKAVAVWCADDRVLALNRAKHGETIEERECDNPVARHVALADRLGLQGTPMIIVDTGQKINGYLPVGDLVGQMEAFAGKAVPSE